MHAFPPVPDVADAPPSLFDGHVWLQEWVPGGPLRVRLEDSGLLTFGDADRVFDADDVPLGYRRAVNHVREHFDREALRGAVDDVESVVFYGVATRRDGVEYDWERLPPFLGFDVYHGDDARFLPPDVVDVLYDRLGLGALPAVRKELRGTDFDPDEYELPASTYRDGPAAGVLVRNKTGDRAKLSGVATEASTDAFEDDPEDLAARLVTESRLERVTDASDGPDGVDAVVDCVLETVAREEYDRLLGDDAAVDVDAFRSAAAERTRRLLDAT